MKNKSIIIIISTVLVLGIIGAGFWFFENQKENNNKEISQKEIITQEDNQSQKKSDMEEIDTNNGQSFRNGELSFEIISPEKIFDTKFRIYKEDKDVIRFYDVGCEYNEIGTPAKDCVNINIYKKKLNTFTENDKNIYKYNFNDNSIINGKKFIIEWNNQINDKQLLYGANAIFDNEDSYYFIMIGGVYFDFTPELVEKYKTFISTFKILE